jgi:hippurate hydrolase
MWTKMVNKAVGLRRELHQFPETAWKETGTAERVRNQLSDLGLSWTERARTGTTVTLAPSASGPHIALRADIDGLPIAEASGAAWTSQHPGRMHACGHDGHTATLLLAANSKVKCNFLRSDTCGSARALPIQK